jgi:hypothetical protein
MAQRVTHHFIHNIHGLITKHDSHIRCVFRLIVCHSMRERPVKSSVVPRRAISAGPPPSWRMTKSRRAAIRSDACGPKSNGLK